jgi:hypothetical protein
MRNNDILTLLHSDSGDNERLAGEFQLSLTNSVDISILARKKGYKKTNLKEQTKVLLGEREREKEGGGGREGRKRDCLRE